MRSLRALHAFLAGTLLALLCAYSAQAALSSRVAVSGKVADFDDRYLYLDAKVERYRIKRSAVPDSIDLHPGSTVSFEIPFTDFRIIPATAPAVVPPSHYSPPRKRTPAQD
jgi:hypothetical protein